MKNKNTEKKINLLKNFIFNEYGIKIQEVSIPKRGYMAETFTFKASDSVYFAKIVYYESHKDAYKESFQIIEHLNNQGINFIPKFIKTIKGFNFTEFNKGILGLFKFIEGDHTEDYSLNLLFEKYAQIYNINTKDTKVRRESFACESLTLYEQELKKIHLKTNQDQIKKVIEKIQEKEQTIELYKNRLLSLSANCKKNNPALYLTHGDGQGNVIKNENDIYLIDWDTPLLAPIERDLWVFINNEKLLKSAKKIFEQSQIIVNPSGVTMSYYCYYYFFYYLAIFLEILNFHTDENVQKKIYNDIKDLFGGWILDRIKSTEKYLPENSTTDGKNIDNKNIFMICEKINTKAFSKLSNKYHIRNCKKNELEIWKRFPFDSPEEAKEYMKFMDDFYLKTYKERENLFFEKCLFVCDKDDKPIGTCFLWKTEDNINAISWFKVLKEYEGLGIGRALLSQVLFKLEKSDLPIYIHTQPTSFIAIKLYSDFGFKLITNEYIGKKKNDLKESLSYMKKNMARKDFLNLKTVNIPKKVANSFKHEDQF